MPTERKENVSELEMARMIRQYGNALLRMCFMYLRDRHLAEDAMQDTFIKVFRNYDQFNHQSAEKTWITRIAINVCKNYRRDAWWKRIDESAVLSNIPSGESADPADDSVTLEVMRLPIPYREVILLYYYQGMTVREIAAVRNLPEATVYTRLGRARERLKKKLTRWYFDE